MVCFSTELAVIGLKMFNALIRRKLMPKFVSIGHAKLEFTKFAAHQASFTNAQRESSIRNNHAPQEGSKLFQQIWTKISNFDLEKAFYSMKRREFAIGLIMWKFSQLKLLSHALTESTDFGTGQMATTIAMTINGTTGGVQLGSLSIRKNQSQVASISIIQADAYI